MEDFRPGELWVGANPSPELIEHARRLGIRTIEQTEGAPFPFSGATIEVLARNGVEVVVPDAQGCCGGLAWHTGDLRGARAFARRNLDAFPADVDAILAAVHDVTHTIKAAAIVCWTKSGSTGLRAARERPEVPILALTPIKAMARRLTLAWGLHCVETDDAQNVDDVAERAAQIAFSQGFAKMGDRVVITAGLPLGTPGATNLLRVAYVTRKSA